MKSELVQSSYKILEKERRASAVIVGLAGVGARLCLCLVSSQSRMYRSMLGVVDISVISLISLSRTGKEMESMIPCDDWWI